MLVVIPFASPLENYIDFYFSKKSRILMSAFYFIQLEQLLRDLYDFVVYLMLNRYNLKKDFFLKTSSDTFSNGNDFYCPLNFILLSDCGYYKVLLIEFIC